MRWGSEGGEGVHVGYPLADFVRRRRLELLEGFMRDDIEWALKLKNTAP